ncbi:hypothetical protein CPB85DRAFT_1446329 [Mucidula mucida]|nr:hypothetical protein CPB85DRAFT_1446329 [Mucidula mucida]
MQFLLDRTVVCKLQNPSPNARCLCRSLTSSTGSGGQILPHLQAHLQDLASLDFETIPKEQYYQTAVNVGLAVEAVYRFWNPALLTYTATFIEQFSPFAALFYSLVLNTLCICTCTDDPSFCYATSRVILLALGSLLSTTAGLELFTLSPALLQNMQILVTTWATFSSGVVASNFDTAIVDILNLLSCPPTKEALEYAASTIPKSQLCGAVERLLKTAYGLYDPSFPLPSATLTNVRGLGLIGQIRPSLRRTFFRLGVIECLCDILKRLVIDDPRTSRTWETQKYTAHEQAVEVAQEIYLLLKDEVSSVWPILNVLDCGIIQVVVHAAARFGNNRPLYGGSLPLLLEYIAAWSVRSKRVAVRLRDIMYAVRNDQALWNSLPPSSSAHPLAVGWHTFLDTLHDKMTVMPVTGTLVIHCMNENRLLLKRNAICAVPRV